MKWKLWVSVGVVIALAGSTGYLSFAYTSTNSDLTEANATIAGYVIEVAGLEQDVATLGGELDTVNAEVGALASELDEKVEELNTLSSKYPLRNFSSYTELVDWASSHLRHYSYASDVADYQACYDVAVLAMEDGYRVFVDVDPSGQYMISWCVAVVGSRVYFWCVHEVHYDGLTEMEWLYLANG